MPRRVTLSDDEHLSPASTTTTRPSNSKDSSSTRRRRTNTPKTPATPIPVKSPPYSPLPKDWEREYRILREAYRLQGHRLQALQEENETLRLEIETLVSADSSSIATPQEVTSTCSPGNKFVAELVEVMELDVGQHALLASIMDRQAHQKQKERRRCSM